MEKWKTESDSRKTGPRALHGVAMETVATIDRCDRVVWGRRGGQNFKVYTT
jgi:hypothetical protein